MKLLGSYEKFQCLGYHCRGYIANRHPIDGLIQPPETLYSCSKGVHFWRRSYLMELLKNGRLKNMDINKLYPGGNYINADMIKNKQIPQPLTVIKVTFEEFGDGDKAREKAVLHFEEIEKQMVLNATNAKIIAKELGAETDKWKHFTVTLQVVKTNFDGKLVDSVQIFDVKKA